MKLRALVIDNDMHFCNSVAEVLQDEGIETDVAYFVNGALELIQNNYYHFAVVDLSIHDDHTFEYRHGGGYDLCLFFNKLGFGTNIVVVSGNPYPEIAAELTRMGCMYFSKKESHFRQRLREYIRENISKAKIIYPEDFEIFFTGIKDGSDRDMEMWKIISADGVGISEGISGAQTVINRVIKDLYPFYYKNESKSFKLNDKSITGEVWSLKDGKAVKVVIDKTAPDENCTKHIHLKRVYIKYYELDASRDQFYKESFDDILGQ